MSKHRLILISLAAIIACSQALIPVSTSAVTASDWRAGRIMDDAIFSDKGAMSVDQIQSFLNTKVPVCDTWGTQTSEFGGGTRAQYGAAHGNPAPFTCLKDYYEVPKTTPGPEIPANNYGGKAIPNGAQSAAQIIWNAAQKYNISPKVLLVKIATESAGPLTTDDWPFLKQYTYAMGSHCPDSGPGGAANCDTNYAGFSMQMDSAADLMRWYLDSMDQSWWQYKKPYQVNNILWNVVERGCGGSNVYIETKATAALYTYTPYQPNQAALNNMYGTGDNCSAYGNRNFWRVYSDWFGSTLGSLWRTASSGSLYYVDGERKFLISSIDLINQYGFSLQDVRFVSQQELDAVPNASAPFTFLLGQLVKSENDSDADGGTVYFIDSGKKLPITSIEQFTNYGFDNSMIHYLPLNSIQRLASGNSLSNFIQTSNGTIYQMEAGKKRVFFELSKYNQMNASGELSRLSDFSIGRWPFGQPQVDGSYLIIGPEGTIKLYNGATYHILTSMDTYDCWGLQGLRTYRVSSYDIVNGSSSGNLGCIAKGSDPTVYLMNGSRKYPLSTMDNINPVTVNDDVISRITTATLTRVLRADSGELAVLESNIRRALPSMDTFSRLGYTGSDITYLKPGSYSAFSGGPLKLAAGNLTLDTSGTVSVISSDSSRINISSATLFDHFGYNWSQLLRLNSQTFSAYPSSGLLQYYVKNSEGAYLMDSKKKFFIDPSLDSAVGITRSSLVDVGTGVTSYAQQTDMTRFVTSPNGGTVYYLENGQKRPISSWQKLTDLGGSGKIITLSSDALARFPTGSNL